MSIKIILLTLFLLFSATKATVMEQFLSTLPEPLQQIEFYIMKQFANEYQNVTSFDQLKQEFQIFKSQWSNKMVQYLIRELELDEELATQARKNPDSFYINFDTYKLFVKGK